MTGCTQGNLGLSVTVIDTCSLPVIREYPERSHVAPPLWWLSWRRNMGVMVGKSKGTGV